MTRLTNQQLAALRRSAATYAEDVSADKLGQIMDFIKGSLENVLNPQQAVREGVEGTVTEGFNFATARAEILKLAGSLGAEQLAKDFNFDFMLKTAHEVARGAGRHVADNFDQAEVDEFPALELLRVYERDLPRGLKRVKGGGVIEVPEEAWDTEGGRWPKACEAAGDEDALAVFKETGRMIALKSSGVWQALGDGAGGYTDTLGNPFAPFAFNSGFDTDGVPRAECEELGLLEPGEKVARTEIDLENLFAPLEVAA